MRPIAILRNRPQLGIELAWVALAKVIEFGATFALLKVLSNRLGAAGYGEYHLAEAALVLLHALGIAPVHESFLRAYHGVEARGELRAAMRTLFKGYALSTATVALMAAVLSPLLADSLEIGRWTMCAAGLVFLFDRWRFLGIDYRNIRRERRSSALHAVGYQAALVIGIGTTLWLHPTATAGLFAYAAIAAVAMGISLRKPLADFRALPPATSRAVRSLILGFGAPFAAMLALQWSQGFADRYLIKGMLDAAAVGLYVAAYQVSGIPYTLLFRICNEIVIPIAYERAGDGSDPVKLWAADRVLIGSFALQLASGTVMLALCGIFGRALLVALTSEEFAVPTAMILILATARFAQNLGFAAQSFFALHNQASRLLAYRVLGSVLSIALCAVGIRLEGSLGAAIGAAIAMVIYLAALSVGPGGVWSIINASRQRARATLAA